MFWVRCSLRWLLGCPYIVVYGVHVLCTCMACTLVGVRVFGLELDSGYCWGVFWCDGFHIIWGCNCCTVGVYWYL